MTQPNSPPVGATVEALCVRMGKISAVIYIATDKVVADDVSACLRGASGTLRAIVAERDQLKVEHDKLVMQLVDETLRNDEIEAQHSADVSRRDHQAIQLKARVVELEQERDQLKARVAELGEALYALNFKGR